VRCRIVVYATADLDRRPRVLAEGYAGEVVMSLREPALVETDADGKTEKEESNFHGEDLPTSISVAGAFRFVKKITSCVERMGRGEAKFPQKLVKYVSEINQRYLSYVLLGIE
jgi:hypothetical protein